MLVFTSVATGTFRSQPDIIGIAAATLAATAVRQNWRLSIIIPQSYSCLVVSLCGRSDVAVQPKQVGRVKFALDFLQTRIGRTVVAGGLRTIKIDV